MNCRKCIITFDMGLSLNGIKSDTFVKILQAFPEGTEIAGMYDNTNTGASTMVFQNDKFKEVSAGTEYPRVDFKVEKNLHGDIVVDLDLSEVLENTHAAYPGTIMYHSSTNIAPIPVYTAIFPPDFDLPETDDAVVDKAACKHSWKTYQSLTGKAGNFEFCDHCGVRQDET